MLRFLGSQRVGHDPAAGHDLAGTCVCVRTCVTTRVRVSLCTCVCLCVCVCTEVGAGGCFYPNLEDGCGGQDSLKNPSDFCPCVTFSLLSVGRGFNSEEVLLLQLCYLIWQMEDNLGGSGLIM